MREFATALALVATLALTSRADERADERATTAFLGSETTWRTAQLPLFSGSHGFTARRRVVHVQGSGRVVVLRRERDRERRFEVTIAAQEARALLRLAVEVDLLTVEPSQRAGALDEGRPVLRLRNGRGGLVLLETWVGDDDPGWRRVAGALDRLADGIAEEHAPVDERDRDMDLLTDDAVLDLSVVAVTRPIGASAIVGVELTRDSDLAELRARLRALPRATADDAGREGRKVWLQLRNMRGLPEQVRVGGGVVEIHATPHEDARDLETWLRQRMREAGVDPGG